MASASGRKRTFISDRDSDKNIQDVLDSLDNEPFLNNEFIGENEDVDEEIQEGDTGGFG